MRNLRFSLSESTDVPCVRNSEMEDKKTQHYPTIIIIIIIIQTRNKIIRRPIVRTAVLTRTVVSVTIANEAVVSGM